jgi:hypothetical protein
MGGRFKIIKTGSETIQIAAASSIATSKERYQPNGADFYLGHGKDGSDQDLRISSRIYMTEKQLEAEEASIAYAAEVGATGPESIIDLKADKAPSPQTRQSPYEAFHIKGLGIDFTPIWNDDPQKRSYIYLELDLHKSLDVRSAAIVCGPVNGNGNGTIPGEEDGRTDFLDGEEKLLGWPSFPSSYLFSLETDEKGDLIDTSTGEEPTNDKLGESRYQKKAYVLIGYLSKDTLADSGSVILFDSKAKETGLYMSVVGCVENDLEVSHGLSNETPVLNLSPQFASAQLSSNYFGDLGGGEG